MTRPTLSDEQKGVIRKYFDSGYGAREVMEMPEIVEWGIVLGQVMTQRSEWLVRQRGYRSLIDYQNRLAMKGGYKSYMDRRRQRRLKAALAAAGVDSKYGRGTLKGVLDEYRFFIDERKIQGRLVKRTLAAATYSTLRRENRPVILDEVSALFGLDRWDVAKTYRKLYADAGNVPVPSTEIYIKRSVAKLELPEMVETAAAEFCEKNIDILRISKQSARAAVSVYVEAKRLGESRSAEMVAGSLMVTSQTINNIVRVLRENGRI